MRVKCVLERFLQSRRFPSGISGQKFPKFLASHDLSSILRHIGELFIAAKSTESAHPTRKLSPHHLLQSLVRHILDSQEQGAWYRQKAAAPVGFNSKHISCKVCPSFEATLDPCVGFI